MMRDRRGFTLTELLVGTIVMGVVGLALTRILINDSRFVSRIEAMMNARQSARAALNTLSVELRMVATGGILAATPDSIAARVPFAFGVMCPLVGPDRYAVVVPGDWLTYVTAVPEGLAWRSDATNLYTSETLVSIIDAPIAEYSNCTGAGIQTIPDGPVLKMTFTPDTVPVGAVFHLYQTVRYWFGPSAELPGQRALWRQVGFGPPAEELLAPFDASARLRYYLRGIAQPQDNPGADLTKVVGLDLRLVGAADFTPQGSSEPPSFELQTRVNFLNSQ